MMNDKTTSNIDFVFALLKAASRIERRFDRMLSNTRGISYTEYRLLRDLQMLYNGSATRVDLAAAVNLTPSAVTRALKPLEKMGYVTTEKSERDARRSLASLTTAGHELLRDSEAIVSDEVATMTLPSSVTDELIGELSKLGPR